MGAAEWGDGEADPAQAVTFPAMVAGVEYPWGKGRWQDAKGGLGSLGWILGLLSKALGRPGGGEPSRQSGANEEGVEKQGGIKMVK